MKQILIVEDQADIVDLLNLVLIDSGYIPTEVYNCFDALEFLEKDYFDLIILDLMLPGMNGNQFLAELTRRQIKVPVIVASAAFEALIPHPNVKKVVPKPFRVRQILQAVEECLRPVAEPALAS
ncbi:MAG TPA: response regulator [Chloroflexia bacterium]|nr:response regulator [Chloroflexia bacterium]